MTRDPINTGSQTLGLLVANTQNLSEERRKNSLATASFLQNAYSKLYNANTLSLEQEQRDKDNAFKQRSLEQTQEQIDNQKSQWQIQNDLNEKELKERVRQNDLNYKINKEQIAQNYWLNAPKVEYERWKNNILSSEVEEYNPLGEIPLKDNMQTNTQANTQSLNQAPSSNNTPNTQNQSIMQKYISHTMPKETPAPKPKMVSILENINTKLQYGTPLNAYEMFAANNLGIDYKKIMHDMEVKKVDIGSTAEKFNRRIASLEAIQDFITMGRNEAGFGKWLDRLMHEKSGGWTDLNAESAAFKSADTAMEDILAAGLSEGKPTNYDKLRAKEFSAKGRNNEEQRTILSAPYNTILRLAQSELDTLKAKNAPKELIESYEEIIKPFYKNSQYLSDSIYNKKDFNYEKWMEMTKNRAMGDVFSKSIKQNKEDNIKIIE
ncbi:hypothetical protein B6S12_05055 [Helicobacter valdiviensis]|uniref:Uncharacterized protein n=1 Tax=Helicobacter valdiviensis TaxID=1458358 RepID=A0A2W6NGT7_9HELI|nr:hypothetical protein [Helicobacter valdiviensis]PZT48190.1 hypothetical protein B6S12_05055 [Helicobacter valdiviensis]